MKSYRELLNLRAETDRGLAALKAEGDTILKAVEDGKATVEQEARLGDLAGEIQTRTAEAVAIRADIDRHTKLRDQMRSEPVNQVDQRVDTSARPVASMGEHLQLVLASSSGPFAAKIGTSPSAAHARLQEAAEYQRIKAAATGSNVAVPSEGGYLVGEATSGEFLRNVHETGVLMSRVTRRPVPMGVSTLKFRGIDETSRADGSRLGGVQAFWDGEGDTLTGSQPKFKWVEISPKKLTGLYYATGELMRNVAGLSEDARSWFTEEMGFKIDDAIINGDGAGKPLGILNSDSLVSVSKETGQAATTVVYENIVKMYARTWVRSRPNLTWLINQDVEPQLHTMSLSVGTGGVPVYLPAGGAAGSPLASLYGRPVVAIEQAATLGTVGDLILADLTQYIVGEQGGIEVAVSEHVRFLNDEVAFRFILHIDGQPRLDSALTPFKGTGNTVSPFVALATRA